MLDSRSLLGRLIATTSIATAMIGAAALGSGTASADPAPSRQFTAAILAPVFRLESLHVGGTQIDADAISSEPTSFTYKLTRVDPNPPPAVTPVRGVFAPIGDAVFAQDLSAPVFQTRHHLHLTGLTSNTAYDLLLVATTRSGQRLTASTRFTTLKRRVKVTLDKIVISDDGDVFGDGEPTWLWQVGWPGGTVKDCFPKTAANCKQGSFDEGTIFPTFGGKHFTFIFAEENFQPVFNPNQQPGDEDFTSFPQQFRLAATAHESDGIFGFLDAIFDGYARIGGEEGVTWTAPLGPETAFREVRIGANDGNFSSVMHFTFQLFHDNQTYQPNDGRVFSTTK